MRLAIVVPMYNEELCITRTVDVLTRLIEKYIEENLIENNSYILLVDDGSKDGTWNKTVEIKENNQYIKAIKFSKNFGNQYAIIAGYKQAQNIGCDAVVTIDADLQQDETKIKDFIEAYNDGYEIVCGIRRSYDNKYSFKSITSYLFYKVINFLGVYLHPNHSEYRLVGKKALNIINQYKETNIFVRGMIYDLGLKTKYISYNIRKREFGESKFNVVSLAKMAASAVVMFSIRPLRLVFLVGAVIATISMILAVLMFIQMWLEAIKLPNSVRFRDVVIMFVLGMQILCTGIIGEYIGQILIEIKGRPRYIIDEEID